MNMNKEEQKRLDAEKIMAMTNFKKFYPEHSSATVEKIVEKEVVKEVPDPKLELELMELKDLLEFKDEDLKNIKDALSNALNEEQAIKQECSECKQRLDSYIRENAKLNKDIEKYKADNIKLKKAVTELTTQ